MHEFSERLRNELITIAKGGKEPISYSELVRQSGLEWVIKFPNNNQDMISYLTEIFKYEDDHGRPPLTFLAVYKNSIGSTKERDHGTEFYTLLENAK